MNQISMQIQTTCRSSIAVILVWKATLLNIMQILPNITPKWSIRSVKNHLHHQFTQLFKITKGLGHGRIILWSVGSLGFKASTTLPSRAHYLLMIWILKLMIGQMLTGIIIRHRRNFILNQAASKILDIHQIKKKIEFKKAHN